METFVIGTVLVIATGAFLATILGCSLLLGRIISAALGITCTGSDATDREIAKLLAETDPNRR